MKKLLTCLLVLGMVSLAQAKLKGLWEFNDPGNLTKATVGNDLILRAIDGYTPTETAVAGGAVSMPKGSYYQAAHGIEANGGGSWVNEYTFLIDFKYSQNSADAWMAIFQTGYECYNDSDYFKNPSQEWGLAALGGYQDLGTAPDVWYRMVLSADLGTSFQAYVDGQLKATYSVPSIDGRLALYTASDDNPYVCFFGDNDGDDAEIIVDNLAIWDTPLTAQQIRNLGGPGSPIPEPATMALLGLGGLALIRRKKSA